MFAGSQTPLIATATARLHRVWPEMTSALTSALSLSSTCVAPITELLATLDAAEPMFVSAEEQAQAASALLAEADARVAVAKAEATARTAAAKAEAIADATARIAAVHEDASVRIAAVQAEADRRVSAAKTEAITAARLDTERRVAVAKAEAITDAMSRVAAAQTEARRALTECERRMDVEFETRVAVEVERRLAVIMASSPSRMVSNL